MVTRSAAGNAKILKEQYELLKDALNDYYAGAEVKAIEIAVHIRTLVHQTDSSHAFLATMVPNYRKLDIYHKSPNPKAIFSLMQGISMSGDGKSKFIRDDFSKGSHELVPLERWWTEPYLKIGPSVHSSKKDVVLDVANKDGGAHVDPKGVPTRHAAATEPPLYFGVNENRVRPNLARSTVAQAGNELLDYLERHFAAYVSP
jgi:hypothetical protein